MESEQEERPSNGPLKVIQTGFHKAFQKLGTWKLEIISFFCGLVVLVILLAVLFNLDGEDLPPWEQHNPQVEIGILLFLLYAFLLIPVSNSLRRIKQIHTAHPPRIAILESSNEKVQQSVYAVKKFFTFRAFGIAPTPVLALLVVATVTIAPWAIAILGHQTLLIPVSGNVWGTPSVPIARDLKSVLPDSTGDVWHEGLLLSAIHRGLVGKDHVDFKPSFVHRYPSDWDGFWDDYGTIEIRSRCTDVTEHLEMSSSYSVFQSLRNVTSLPPYNPLDESRAKFSSPSIMSLKNTTFVTLSNIRSHTGSWKTANDCSGKLQITREALETLRKFSSVVVNPVSGSLIKDPVFSQTSGTLQNFHVIYAELGISGHFDEFGRLNWIDLKRGVAAAWECSLDTVVNSKQAYFSYGDFSEYMGWNGRDILPLEPVHANQTCLEAPKSCSNSSQRTIDFLWDGKRFSIDKGITSRISEHLERFYAGSSFGQDWLSITERGTEPFNATSSSAFFVHNLLSNSVEKWRGTESLRWEPLRSIYQVFASTAARLSYFLREFNGDCLFSDCQGNEAIGQLRRPNVTYQVRWGWITLPALLVVGTALIMLAAALDEHYYRIRLVEPDEDEDADDTDARPASTSDRDRGGS